MKHLSRNESDTYRLGRALAHRLQNPSVILLIGELGAGKTAFVRGVASALGVPDDSDVHSPSFSLINEYAGSRGPIYHVDLYRLESENDFYSIGLDELLLCDADILIEWAERLPWKIREAVRVTFEVQTDESRIIDIRGI